MELKKIGDSLKQLLIREENGRLKEFFFEEYLTSINRDVLQKVQAEHKKYLQYKDNFLK